MPGYKSPANTNGNTESARGGDSCWGSAEKPWRRGCVCVLVALFALGVAGCGSAKKKESGSNESPDPINVPVGSIVADQTVRAGVTTFEFVYDPPVNPVDLPLTGLSVDLQKTLQALTVTPAPAPAPLALGGVARAAAAVAAAAEGSVQVSARVSAAADEATVCDDGELYGPYEVTGVGPTQPQNISPSSAQATQATLSILNTGSIAICIVIESPYDAQISVDDVTVTPEECHDTPEDVGGMWVGKFTCESAIPGCYTADEEDITLDIEVSAGSSYSASYSDGEADYDGTVCGRVFRYNGGGEGYLEEGTFTLDSDDPNKAIKRSEWKDIDGPCSGTCVDHLNLYVIPGT